MNRALPAILIAGAGFLLGQAAYTVWQGASSAPRLVAWEPSVRWIGPLAPSYQAYYRHTFYVESRPQSAWLRLSADNSFELYVNGALISKESNPTNYDKGLGDGLVSKIDQRVNDSRNYRSPVEPGHLPVQPSASDWKLCVYEDIGRYLYEGRNVIAVSVGNANAQPRLAIEGAVQVTPERRVSLDTGSQEWVVSDLPENHGRRLWYESQFPDLHWARAASKGPVSEATYSRISRTAIEECPWGQWITAAENASGEVWLRGQWHVPELSSHAFIRTAANTTAGVTINGRLIDDPNRAQLSRNNLLIYDASRLVRRGTNEVAVRLARPLPGNHAALGGAAPQFYLDGWVESESGSVASRFATDKSWTGISDPAKGWQRGAGSGEPVLVLGAQNLNELSRRNRGDAAAYDYLALAPYAFAALAGGVAAAFILAFGLNRYWLPQDVRDEQRFAGAAAILLPGMAAMSCIALLSHRYQDTDVALFLTDFRTAVILLVSFFLVTALSLFKHWLTGFRSRQPWANGGRLAAASLLAAIAVGMAWSDDAILRASLVVLAAGFLLALVVTEGSAGRAMDWIRRFTSYRFVAATLLGAIVAGGFFLRAQALPELRLTPDENTSLDVVRGILRSGAPEATAGIWYTRSPVYHYAAAGWLYLVGDSIAAVQMFSVLWGSALLVVTFFLARKITQRNDLSLLATAFLAVDRWLVVGSRVVRFYIVAEFMTLLCFLLFYKGFVERGRPAYRYAFFVSLTMAMLNQEMMITLIPIFLLGFVIFYRPFKLREDWPLIAATALVAAIFMFDVFVFYAKCLTPTIALGSTTDSIAKPHLRYVTAFFNGFFLGSARFRIILSFFFFAGLVHSVVRRDMRRFFLYASVLIYVAELTMLLRQTSVHYTRPIYSLFVLAAFIGALDLARALGERFGKAINLPLTIRASLATIVLATLLLSDDYPNLLWGRQEQLVVGTSEAARYIRDVRAETDLVMSPAAPTSAVELGGLDYFIAGDFLRFDIPYRDGNVVRDRWAGGIHLSNPEAFARVFHQADRVWIYYDELTETRLNPAMRLLMRTTGRPVMESYATTLRVWERDRDPFPQISQEGRENGPY